MEGAGGDEQDVVGAHHAVLGAHRGAFDQRQQVALHAFAGHVGAAGLGALGHLVQLIDKDDAVVFHHVDGLHLELVFVDEAGRFLVTQQAQRFAHFQLLRFLAATAAHAREHLLQLAGHFFHARRRHDLHALRVGADFDFDFLVVQFAFAQFFAEDLAGVGIIVGLLAAGVGQQGVEHPVLGGVFRLVPHAGHFLFAQQFDRHFHQIADDGFHVPAHIAHLGELGGFDLQEGRVGQFRQAPRDFGFTDAGGADHKDVLGRHFGAHLFRQLHAPPAVAQGQGHRLLGVFLADDVPVEFADDVTGRQGGHYSISSKV